MRKTRAGQLLAAWVKERDISQEQLAAEVTEAVRRKVPEARPVNQSTVCSWIIGRSEPRGGMMVAIKAITGIAVEAWLEPPLPSADDTGAHRAIPGAPASADSLPDLDKASGE